MVRNFLHLSILRGINLVFPLLLMPYLLHTIGLDYFGLYSTAWAYLGFMILLAEGGFHTYGTRAVAQNMGNSKAISNLFWNINTLKVIVVLAIAAIIFLLNYGIAAQSLGMSIFYSSGLFMALCQCLQPVWLFQGLEKMDKLLYLNLISKVISAMAIFVFIQKPEDYPLSLWVLSLGDMVACILANLSARKIVKFDAFSFENLQLKHHFVGVLPFFQTNIGISIYTILPTILLSWFTNATVVGYFSVAERLNNVVKTILIVFDQSIYPQLFKKAKESHEKLTLHVKKYFPPYLIGMFVLSALVYYFTPHIIQLVGDEPLPESVQLLRIMLIIPLIITLDMPSISMLIVYGREKIISRIMTIGAVMNLILNLILIPKYGAIAVVLNLIITELIVFVLVNYYSCIKYKEESVYFNLWACPKNRLKADK